MKGLNAPAPKMKAAAESTPGAAAMLPPAPKTMFKELPGGMSTMGKARIGPVPKISLEERAKDARSMTFDLRGAVPAPLTPAPPLPAAPGGAEGFAPGTLRVEQSTHRFGFAAEQAQMFARKRADEVTQQMLASLARRHNVPVDELKKAVDRARKGAGWVPKGDEPPLLLTLEDATAYFNIEQTVPKVTPLVIREYAAPRPGTADGYLHESRDTILWQPVIVLPSDGKAKVQFHLGDAPGGYQVVVGGHTLDGRIGAVRGMIPVSPPQLTDSRKADPAARAVSQSCQYPIPPGPPCESTSPGGPMRLIGEPSSPNTRVRHGRPIVSDSRTGGAHHHQPDDAHHRPGTETG